MSDFDRVADVVAEAETKFHVRLFRDGVEFTPVVPVAPGLAGWRTILRTSVWHAAAGDELPAPIALLLADGCVMLGIPPAVALFQATVQRHMNCVADDLQIQPQFAAYVSASSHVPGYLAELARKYQALVLLALFQSDLWRDGHAHLAERLRHTLTVALSWCDQKEMVE